MCTVTWWREPDGDSFGVWFNRDERRTRATSQPVRLQRSVNGTEYLAPTDPTGGGTWLMANAHGLVVGVLNFYAATATATALNTVAPEESSAQSRGTLPVGFAGCDSVGEVDNAINVLETRRFAPFIVIAWDRERVASWAWDGVTLGRDPAPVAPLTTSSFRSDEVCAWRRARYAELVARATAESLAAYHHDVAHDDPAFNVRMRRPDARTESVCRVRITRRDVRFQHQREAADALTVVDALEVRLTRDAGRSW